MSLKLLLVFWAVVIVSGITNAVTHGAIWAALDLVSGSIIAATIGMEIERR